MKYIIFIAADKNVPSTFIFYVFYPIRGKSPRDLVYYNRYAGVYAVFIARAVFSVRQKLCIPLVAVSCTDTAHRSMFA